MQIWLCIEPSQPLVIHVLYMSIRIKLTLLKDLSNLVLGHLFDVLVTAIAIDKDFVRALHGGRGGHRISDDNLWCSSGTVEYVEVDVGA